MLTLASQSVCGRSIEQVHRQLRLHPDCKKQQHVHLVETGAQIQTVRFWRAEELHRRLHLNDLDDMAKSIVIPKISESTYRLLLKLVNEGVLETEMTPGGSRVIYPAWTATWTRLGWDGDVSREAGEAVLAREAARERRRQGDDAPAAALMDSIRSLGTKDGSLAVAEEQKSAALLDFYRLSSDRRPAYTSSVRRLARLDTKLHQSKAVLNDSVTAIYNQLHQMIVTE